MYDYRDETGSTITDNDDYSNNLLCFQLLLPELLGVVGGALVGAAVGALVGPVGAAVGAEVVAGVSSHQPS